MKSTILILLMLCSSAVFGEHSRKADIAQHCTDALSKENILETEYLSSTARSDLELCRTSDTMGIAIMRMDFDDANSKFWKTYRDDTASLWLDLRDVYCEFHPSAEYLDFFGNVEQCPKKGPPVHTSKEEVEKLFSQSNTANVNAQMFAQSQNCNGEQDCLQKQVDAYKPLVDSARKGAKPNK